MIKNKILCVVSYVIFFPELGEVRRHLGVEEEEEEEEEVGGGCSLEGTRAEPAVQFAAAL